MAQLLPNINIPGLTSREEIIAKGFSSANRELAAEQRAQAAIANPRPNIIRLPIDTPDHIVTKLQSEFQESDFAKDFRRKPHHLVAAARKACVQTILRDLAFRAPASITLVGPSFWQYQLFATAFPNALIHVYQPVDSSRDIARWSEHIQHISHPEPWTALTAVPSEAIVAILSLGQFHPSDFFAAALIAKATQVFALHHWAAECLVQKEFYDDLSTMHFSRQGDKLTCTLDGSSSYFDSVAATADWLFSEHGAHNGSITADRLHSFGSLKLVHYKIGRGKSSTHKANLHNLDREYALLPAFGRFPAQVILRKTFDRIVDYLSRQPDEIVTATLARNRLSALSHRVAIGSAVIQDAIHVPEALAEHTAEVAFRVVRLRAAVLVEERAQLQLAIDQSQTDSILQRNARNLDGRLGLALTAAELSCRIGIKAFAFAPRVSANIVLSVSGSAKRFESPCSITPISGSAARSSLGKSYHFLASVAEKDLGVLTAPPSQYIQGAATSSSDFWVNSRRAVVRNTIDLAAKTISFYMAVAYYALPARSLALRAKFFAVARRLPHALSLNLQHYIRLRFGYSLGQAIWDFFFVLTPGAAAAGNVAQPPPSTHSSDHDSDDDQGGDEVQPEHQEQPEDGEPEAPPPAEPTAEAPPPAEPTTEDPNQPPPPQPGPDATGQTSEPLTERGPTTTADGANTRPLNEAPALPFNITNELEVEGDLSSLTFQVQNIKPLFSAVTEQTDLDRNATIQPFELIGRGISEDALLVRPTVPSLGKTAIAGPHSLYRSIASGIINRYAITKEQGARCAHLVKSAVRDTTTRPTEQFRANHTVSEQAADRNTRIRDFISRAEVRVLDVSVDGLPASGKSSLVRDFLCDDDLIITPTNQLKDDWKAKLQGCRARVMTFDAAILSGRKYRMVVIDELYIFEAQYINAFANLGRVVVGLGDKRQIASFHLRNSALFHPFDQSMSRLHILAPYSLGLPAPVLALGIALGLAPLGSITANGAGKLSVYVDAAYPTDLASAENCNIVFNRGNLAKEWITAHESQGSRPKTANVYLHPDEEHFVPATGHFWTAITRATEHTHLFLTTRLLHVVLNAVYHVDGRDTYRVLAQIEAIAATFPHNQISVTSPGYATAIISARDNATEAASTYITATAYTESYLECISPAVFHVDVEVLNSSLVKINDNFERTQYVDVVDLVDMELPGEPTVRAQFQLDLQAAQARTTSILNPAGVPFHASDTKTELFTISTRYLCNAPFSDPDPQGTASEMVRDFLVAYVDPLKTDLVPLDRASTFHDWLASRLPGTFRPAMEEFLETRFSLSFSSFLKSHAKAKNSSGFGQTIEKGQTIAAGSQQYNSRYTTLCRQLTSTLQQVLFDDVVLDVGFSDHDFQSRCNQLQLYEVDNTQIDLSSQDSTHRESHVLAFIQLLALFTDATEDECQFYYNMRRSYTVRAKSYDTSNSIVYECNWVLPSGDPFTLLANCIHEATSTAFVFKLKPRTRGKCYIKGDDQYYSKLLHMDLLSEIRRRRIGVIFKFEYSMPPFAAGRFITPDNRAFHDPIKHAAKYSVKNLAPERYSEYAKAYADLFPPVADYVKAYLELAALAHHPSLDSQDVSVLFNFAYSLWNYDFLVSFQKPQARQPLKMIDTPTNCAVNCCKAAGYPVPPPQIGFLQLEEFCRDHEIPYRSLPFLSVPELRFISYRHPNVLIFSSRHALISIPSLVFCNSL